MVKLLADVIKEQEKEEKKEQGHVRMYFYGSLRKDQYNYNRFVKQYGEEAFKWQFRTYASGYILVDSGNGYPYAIKTGVQSDTVRCDVFNVREDVAMEIAHMELSAGYKMEKLYTGLIFYYDTKIKDGDWVEYLKQGDMESNH